MAQYIVWNLKQQAWVMSEFIGFTDDVESAGIFSEEYLEKNTGIFNTRTGDYANNILVEAYTLVARDFKERVIKLPSADKKALKKAIMQEKKNRGQPIEETIKDGKKYCPYCKQPIKKEIVKINGLKCSNCSRIYLRYEEW